ncbi:hypothetical protein F5H01DRAFT_352682 [Linnemannia elongata]|nr:hypothetical protein F5H01DRAFT_352682 [Linnemannia elongata]
MVVFLQLQKVVLRKNVAALVPDINICFLRCCAWSQAQQKVVLILGRILPIVTLTGPIHLIFVILKEFFRFPTVFLVSIVARIHLIQIHIIFLFIATSIDARIRAGSQILRALVILP